VHLIGFIIKKNLIATFVIHPKLEAMWCQNVLQTLQRTLTCYVCLLWALSISVGNTSGVYVNHVISSGSVRGCSASVFTFFLTDYSYYSTNFPRHYMRLQHYRPTASSKWAQGDDVYISQNLFVCWGSEIYWTLTLMEQHLWKDSWRDELTEAQETRSVVMFNSRLFC